MSNGDSRDSESEWDNPHPAGATNHSASCKHPNTMPHPHTRADGSTHAAGHCPSCGMEWGG